MQGQQFASAGTGDHPAKAAVHPMAQLLEEELTMGLPKRGDVVEGIIVGVRPTEVFVDIGYKQEGIVTSRDLERLDKETRKSLKVGEKVRVYIVRPEDREGNLILSLQRAQMEEDWIEAQRIYDNDDILEETVAGFNRGGLIINVGQVRGFLPASQVVSVRIPRDGTDEEREEALNSVVGTKLRLKIIEIDQRRNRLILSERAAVRMWRKEQKDHLLESLAAGEVRKGVVSSLCDFGAFVDLGGADGLVHLSELSWKRVNHPRQLLKVGQEVDVYVIGVDPERRRIALSIKRLQKEPWTEVAEKYSVGQIVPATITKLTDFGAFARLDEYIEGLVHISELSEEHIGHPSEILTEGEQVNLRIIRIEPERQRIGLSLKRVNEDPDTSDEDWRSDDLLDQGSPTGEEN
ncbi:MAG: 30S ribosomal protein S1 [Anaerolineae bacterium]